MQESRAKQTKKYHDLEPIIHSLRQLLLDGQTKEFVKLIETFDPRTAGVLVLNMLPLFLKDINRIEQVTNEIVSILVYGK